MASLESLIVYLALIVFPFGQLLRLSFLSYSFPLLDITIGLLAVTNIINLYLHRQLHPRNQPFLIFLLITIFSLITNLFLHHLSPLEPILYFLRLSALVSFFIFPIPSSIFTPKVRYFLRSILISVVLFGLVQYFLWPDSTYLKSLEWDPHLNRLIGSFLDPTFTALILLFFFFTTYLSTPNLPLLALIYLSLALTYSRSGLLAFVVGFVFLAFKSRNVKSLIISIILVAITLVLLPQPYGEGTNLTRTASIMAKITNYKEGIGLFVQSPLIGWGYDTLPQIRHLSIFSHAASGFDSSLLTVLVTTGIFGFVPFFFGLKRHFIPSSTLSQTLLIITLCHSLFANSLLYPWILLLLIVLPLTSDQARYHK